jgi:hypothetical protein
VRSSFEGGIHAQIAAQIKDVEARTKRSVRNANPWDSRSRNNAGTKAVLYVGSVLFNYNTVEAIMLACAVLLTLAGIMFESERLKLEYYAGDRDAVAGIAITILLGSIIYFLVVCLVELYLACY